MPDITLLLHDAERGVAGAADALMGAVYAELCAMASVRLGHERCNATLEPTALVHEAWLRLGGDRPVPWKNRAHFFSAAAEAMRRILIDRARRRHRLKHGANVRPVTLDEAVLGLPAAVTSDQVLMVDEALARFSRVSADRAELVKLRFFAGLSLVDAAQALGISESTARRWWTFARAWLAREIAREV